VLPQFIKYSIEAKVGALEGIKLALGSDEIDGCIDGEEEGC